MEQPISLEGKVVTDPQYLPSGKQDQYLSFEVMYFTPHKEAGPLGYMSIVEVRVPRDKVDDTGLSVTRGDNVQLQGYFIQIRWQDLNDNTIPRPMLSKFVFDSQSMVMVQR